MSNASNNQTRLMAKLEDLIATRDSLKEEIAIKTSQMTTLLHPYFSRPPNEVLLTPSFRARLAAMIKHIIGRHQLLYNTFMDIADLASHLPAINKSHGMIQAQKDWLEVGKKLGQEFYRVGGFLNEKDERLLKVECSFEWKA